jgi:hypothetical protein
MRYPSMRYFCVLLAFAFSMLLASCKHNQGASNEFKDAKVHPSDREAKDRKKQTDKAEKEARKRLKKARKAHGLKT